VKFGLLGAALLAAGLGISQEASARSETFGQETAETRTPRYQRAPQQGRHNHHAHDGHNHDGHGRHPGDAHFGHGHGIETESLFGFVLGSDTEHAGARGIALEIVGRFGKRDGSYTGIGKKLEFAYGITDRVSAGVGLFAINQRITAVTGFDDVRTFSFNGIGGELRWNLAKRGPSPVGVTLHFEPSWQTHDELSGLRGTKYGAENKLIFDTELVKDKWFAAFNLLYEVERVQEKGETDIERASKFGFGFAMTHQIAHHIYVGLETRYLRAYDGLTLNDFTGEALYLGPTLYAKLADNAWLSLAWNRQVWGAELGNPERLDLANFERNQVRLKAGFEF
jgi:hypothetical protein